MGRFSLPPFLARERPAASAARGAEPLYLVLTPFPVRTCACVPLGVQDLKNMGFALVSYTVNQVQDSHG